MADTNDNAQASEKSFKDLLTQYGKLRIGSLPDAKEIELCLLDDKDTSGCSIKIFHSGETRVINPLFRVNDAPFIDEIGKEPLKMEGVAHEFAKMARKVLLGNPTQEDADNLGKLTVEIQKKTIRQLGEPLRNW